MINNTKFWIVGEQLHLENGVTWGFAGLFSSEKLAIKACKTIQYFVGPCFLNKKLPNKIVNWPGLYFPLYNKKK